MAEALRDKAPSLAEDYLLKGKEEKQDVPVEVKEAENPASTIQVVVSEKAAETLAAVAEESTKSSVASPEDNSSKNATAAAEESSEENSGDQEAAVQTRELRLETAPADFRFPTTNQTRHCFTRYIEYHRCVAVKGDDASECDKFSKYYRALCPGEWVDRWNEQRENGTFPGPL